MAHEGMPRMDPFASPPGRSPWRVGPIGALVAAIIGLACGASSSGRATPAEPMAIAAAATTLALPAPDRDGVFPLERAIQARRSVREFAPTPVSTPHLGQLLWAAQGVTERATGRRAAPSAGATYPLDLFVALPDGWYHYEPVGHALTRLATDDRRARLAIAGLDQPALGAAPAIVVMTGRIDRTRARYGDRALRFVWQESGHAAQNLLLQAVSLDLAAVPIGGFDEQAVRTAVDLASAVTPLYLLPLGHPRRGPATSD